jgi:predicted nucleic acid-binding protein
MDDLLLDACVALNLLASGIDLTELAMASDVRFRMTTVVASEMLWLDPLDSAGEREQFDSVALVGRGVTLITLDEEESERYVDLAHDIDDGEASTIAVAIHRGLRVATDDRKAARLATSQTPPIHVTRTTTLLRRWTELSGAEGERVRQVLHAVRNRASYVPSRDDPHIEWWGSVTCE